MTHERDGGTAPWVLVAGEALVDVVVAGEGRPREHPGGSSANAAVALARLGRRVAFATALARDRHGHLLEGHLRDNAVHVLEDPFVLDRTATAVATLGEGGAATYEFDIEWRLHDALALPPGRPSAVVLGSIGAALSPGAEQVAALVEPHAGRALVVLDVNARPAITGTGADVVRRAERMAGLADVVKASDEDLAALWPDLATPDVVARLLDLGPRAVVVTHGAEGVEWHGRSGRARVAAPPTRVADTIGAGDTVTAALVDALWELGAVGEAAGPVLETAGREVWEAVLGSAAAAAAVTVSRPGADPPYRSELG
jgi:fructokinase